MNKKLPMALCAVVFSLALPGSYAAEQDLASTPAANVVKGYQKMPGFTPEPKILLPSQAFTSPDVYNSNQNWRESVYSGDQGQIVMMTITPQTNPDNDVPNEVHDFDQMIFIQSGDALVSFNGGAYQDAPAGSWILAPAYTPHHIKNKSTTTPLKLLSVYTKWDTPQASIAFKTKAQEDQASH